MTDNTNWLEHPEVKELSQNIVKITADLDQYQASLSELEAEIAKIDAAKEDFMESIKVKIAEYDNMKQKVAYKRMDLRDQLRNAQTLKQELEVKMKNKVDEFIQAEALKAVQERFDALVAKHEFLWATSIRPFQMVAARAAAQSVLEGKFGFAILDQMGLGKTLEATAAMDIIQSAWAEEDATRPPWLTGALSDNAVLWVCPNSIKVTTEREIAKWAPDRVVVQMEGDPAMRKAMVKHAHMAGATLIVSYEQLRNRNNKPVTPELFEYKWPIIVLDEAHKFKNEDSSTFENVERLCLSAGAIIPMTGTPILNRPDEFWAVLHMLTLKGEYQGKFSAKWRFIQEYCYTYGYNNSQASFSNYGFDKLIRDVKDIVIRRKKDEVSIELPDKERIVHHVELSDEERVNYDAMRDSFAIMIDNEDKDYISASSILAVFTRLRQLALWQPGVKIEKPDGKIVEVTCQESAKIGYAMELIEELLANDEKVLVFSNYNEALKEVQRRVNKLTEDPKSCQLIIGGQNSYERADIADEFNVPESRLRVLCGNIAAMGVGLNLQGACSNGIFLDSGWNPGVNEQAEDRLHRGGQKNNVMIHYIQALDTIDGFIASKVEAKANMIEGIIERSELRRAIDEGLI